MSTPKQLATARPLLFSGMITLVFIVLLVVVVLAGRALPGARGTEAGGAVGRVLLTGLFILLLARFGWVERAGLSRLGDTYAWLIVLGPFLYVIVVFPLLFTGRLSLPLEDPLLAALVAGNGLAAGVMEEVVFRGVILCTLLQAWGRERHGVGRSLLVSSLLFSAPHALNVLAGHDVLLVVAQLVWAVLLGAVFGALLLGGGSLWPIAALHGFANAFIHVNRLNTTVQLSSSAAVLLAFAPVPLLIYAVVVLRRRCRLCADDRA